MPTNQIVQDVSNSQSGLPRAFHLMRGAGSRVAWILGGALLLSTANGCLATRSWVQDQMNPMQAQLNNTDAKADKALAGLQNLHLEKKLVLDSTNGPTFASGSAALTANGKREINGFIEDLEGPARLTPRRLRAVSSWWRGIPTTSAARATTTSSDSGELKGSRDTWSARKASTRRKFVRSPTERAGRLPITARRVGGEQIAG